MKNRQVHAIGNDSRFDRAGGKYRLRCFIHQPLSRVRHVKPAPGVDSLLAPPIVVRGVAANGRIDAQIRTPSATGLPSLAVERVSAMAAEQPRVMQGQDRYDLRAQPWEDTQVRIAAGKVEERNDVGLVRCHSD